MFNIEDKGMDEFRDALTYFEKNFPKESKKMLRKVGLKARNIVRKQAKKKVNKLTGNYLKSIKKGRVFVSDTNEITVRVYPSSKIAPHAHLIERGHRNVSKDGSEHGFTPGKYVFEDAGRKIEQEYTKIIETEFDKILKKL